MDIEKYWPDIWPDQGEHNHARWINQKQKISQPELTLCNTLTLINITHNWKPPESENI